MRIKFLKEDQTYSESLINIYYYFNVVIIAMAGNPHKYNNFA